MVETSDAVLGAVQGPHSDTLIHEKSSGELLSDG